MPRPQFLLLLALSAWPCLACAGPKHADEYECGTLDSGGGEFRYSDSSGSNWSLSVTGTDVLLVVDGAEVRFLDGAPSGKLAWGHRVPPDAWYLKLPSGVTCWKGHEIECKASRYLLKNGASYCFDRDGRLVSTEERSRESVRSDARATGRTAPDGR